MSNFVIEKKVPVPEHTIGAPKKVNPYPFKDMEVGDSFFVPLDGRTSVQTRTGVLSMFKRDGYSDKYKLISRGDHKIDSESGERIEGFRFWLQDLPAPTPKSNDDDI